MGAPSALIETWALYSAGSFVILLRLFARIKMVGLRRLKPDDFLVVVSWSFYTAMTVMAHIVGFTGDNGNIPPDVRANMPQQERDTRSLGAKCFMVGWYTYIGTIWILKLNMLFFYQRVVNGLWVEKFIKPAMGIVGATALTILILLSTLCRPFHKLWQVYPDPGPNCIPQSHVFLFTILVLNCSTDLMIMAIPIPVLFRMRVSFARRIGLYCLFGAAIFIMVAAILRVYFVVALKTGASAAIWSCREDLVAVCVGNAPMVRPIFSRKFWRTDFGAAGTTGPSAQESMELSSKSQNYSGRHQGRTFPLKQRRHSVDESESMEQIVTKDHDGKEGIPPMAIQVRNDVHVESQQGRPPKDVNYPGKLYRGPVYD